jgi:hypothetical protein
MTGPCVAPPDPQAKRLAVEEVAELVAAATSAADKSIEHRLKAVWLAIIAGDHPADREIIAQRLTQHATQTGTRAAVALREKRSGAWVVYDGFQHLIDWAQRGWDPFGAPK